MEDDDVDIEANKDEEEEEHPAPADFSVATPPPHPVYRVTARIFIPAPVPTPVWSDAEVSRLLAISTPPSSTPPPHGWGGSESTSYSLPLPPPFILPPEIDAPSSGIPPPLPISVPTSSPPLLLPSASRREDRPEVTLPPRKRLGIALGPRYEVGESSSAAAARPAGGLRADYGFVATMDREIRRDPEREVGYGITDSWDEIVETLLGGNDRMDASYLATEVGFKSLRTTVTGSDGQGDLESSERVEVSLIVQDAAAYTDIDSDAVITGTGDHTTGTGDNTTGTGYRTTRIAGTRWRSCTARVPVGIWNEDEKARGWIMGIWKVKGYVVRIFFAQHDPWKILLASKPKNHSKRLLKWATELMDKKVSTIAERKALENKRKGLVKRSHTGVLNPYALNETITTMVRVLQNAINATNLAILLVTIGVREVPTMLTTTGALGLQPKLFAVGMQGQYQTPTVVTGTVPSQHRYASILFDTGADRSFMSTAFSS
ncbi:putative reverse transcriptase domain-containing protein [Tanacetum coccineum]